MTGAEEGTSRTAIHWPAVNGFCATASVAVPRGPLHEAPVSEIGAALTIAGSAPLRQGRKLMIPTMQTFGISRVSRRLSRNFHDWQHDLRRALRRMENGLSCHADPRSCGQIFAAVQVTIELRKVTAGH